MFSAVLGTGEGGGRDTKMTRPSVKDKHTQIGSWDTRQNRIVYIYIKILLLLLERQISERRRDKEKDLPSTGSLAK